MKQACVWFGDQVWFSLVSTALMEDLQRTWQRLSLIEAKQTVVEDEEEILESQFPLMYYLVGMLCSIRPFNTQALINTMRGIWRPVKNLIVNCIDDNCFLFKFQGRSDIDRVLEGRPWFFDRYVLILG